MAELILHTKTVSKHLHTYTRPQTQAIVRSIFPARCSTHSPNSKEQGENAKREDVQPATDERREDSANNARRDHHDRLSDLPTSNAVLNLASSAEGIDGAENGSEGEPEADEDQLVDRWHEKRVEMLEAEDDSDEATDGSESSTRRLAADIHKEDSKGCRRHAARLDHHREVTRFFRRAVKCQYRPLQHAPSLAGKSLTSNRISVMFRSYTGTR